MSCALPARTFLAYEVLSSLSQNEGRLFCKDVEGGIPRGMEGCGLAVPHVARDLDP